MNYLTHLAAFAVGFTVGWYARKALLHYRARKRMEKISELYEAARLRIAEQQPAVVSVLTLDEHGFRADSAEVTLGIDAEWDPARWSPGGRS